MNQLRPDPETGLAIAGAAPVRTRPFPHWPVYAQDEIDAGLQCLRSGRVNYWSGDEGRSFEREFAQFCGVAHAIAVCNGTVALEIALRALRIGPGDEVIVTPRSFIASASTVAMAGARPVFVDVDADSQNIDPTALRAALTPRTRCLLLVHLAGWPCAMDEIMALARDNDVAVIEDCAQAHGACYKGRPVGSFGDFGAFSFCQDKIISTAGEGGMLVVNDDDLWRRAWLLKDHGKPPELRDDCRPTSPSHAFQWVHDSFGGNGRMTELQAAVGRRQLAKLSGWVAARQHNARQLAHACSGIGALRTPMPGRELEHACYRHYAFLRPERLRAGWDRARILAAINAEGIPCMSGSCGEVYREAAFVAAGLAPAARLPVARELSETSLAFQVHPGVGEREIADTRVALEKVFTVASSN